MIHVLPPDLPPNLTGGGAAGEHQRRTAVGVGGKHWKHRRLIGGRQMEKTVPRDDSGKIPSKRQFTHIRLNPVLIRHPLRRDGQHRCGTVHARHGAALCDEPFGYRLPRTAP